MPRPAIAMPYTISLRAVAPLMCAKSIIPSATRIDPTTPWTL
jgi:hypothetical protein